MNNIITLPKFTELLAQASGRDQRFTERFITEFTGLIIEGLTSDGIVKISGLGQFRVIHDPLKSKIEFVPDSEVSDFINAPFLFFEPTELSDDVSEDMLRVAPRQDSHYGGIPMDRPTTPVDHSSVKTPLSDLSEDIFDDSLSPQNGFNDPVESFSDDIFGDTMSSKNDPTIKVEPQVADVSDDIFGDSASSQNGINDKVDDFTDPFADVDPFSNPFDEPSTKTVKPSQDDGLVFGGSSMDSIPHEPIVGNTGSDSNSNYDDIDAVLGRLDAFGAPAVGTQQEPNNVFDNHNNNEAENQQEYTSRWSNTSSLDDNGNETTEVSDTPSISNYHDSYQDSRNRSNKNPYEKYDYEEKPFPWLWLVVALLVGLGIGFAAGILCHDIILPPTFYQKTDEVIIDNNFTYDEIEGSQQTVAQNDQITEPEESQSNITSTPETPVTAHPAQANIPAPAQPQLTRPEQTSTTQPNNTSQTPTISDGESQNKKIIRNDPLPSDVSTTPNTPDNNDDAPSGVVYDTITDDCWLFDLAKKHYGNSAYWVYIYLENQDIISNPNKLRDGLRVRIPPKSKYDVSTNEEENIKAAKQKSREIFAKFS